MISKFASHADFGNELFTEMDKYMKEEGFDKTASLESEPVENTNALADLLNTVVKCAQKLEEAGHGSFEKADKILLFAKNEII